MCAFVQSGSLSPPTCWQFVLQSVLTSSRGGPFLFGVKRHIGFLASFDAALLPRIMYTLGRICQPCAHAHVHTMRTMNARVLERVRLHWWPCETVYEMQCDM